MTDTSIIIEVAKLDRWTFDEKVGYWRDSFGFAYGSSEPPQFTTSRDVIVPVIVKVCKDQAIRVSFLNTLRELIGGKVSDFDLLVCEVKLLSIALLKATGKWKEED